MKFLDRQGVHKTQGALCTLLFGVLLLVVLNLPSTAFATEVANAASDATAASDVAVNKSGSADQANPVMAEAVPMAQPVTADNNSEDATSIPTEVSQQDNQQAASEERSATSAAAAGAAADLVANATDDLVEGDIYYIHSALNRDKVLDVSGGSAANGANVQLWDKNNTAAQRWKLVRSGQYYLLINESSNKVPIDRLC